MGNVNIASTSKYNGFPPKSGNPNEAHLIQRRITGAELNAAGVPGTDVFFIAELKKGQVVREVETIVIDADSQAITLNIGWYDTNGYDVDDFEANAALNATGITASSDDIVMLSTDGYLTISTSAAIEAATDFIVSAKVEDYSLAVRDTTIAAAL